MTSVEDVLRRNKKLQEIPLDRARAEKLVDDARKHRATADAALQSGDFAGAYQMGYDAARKALTALLALDGLRLRGEGAYANLIELIREKYAGVEGIEIVDKLDRLRSTRNEAEYRGYWFDEDEVRADLEVSTLVLTFFDQARESGP